MPAGVPRGGGGGAPGQITTEIISSQTLIASCVQRKFILDMCHMVFLPHGNIVETSLQEHSGEVARNGSQCLVSNSWWSRRNNDQQNIYSHGIKEKQYASAQGNFFSIGRSSQEIKSSYPTLSPSADMTEAKPMMVADGCPPHTQLQFPWNPRVMWKGMFASSRLVFPLLLCISASVFPRETRTVFLLERLSRLSQGFFLFVSFCWWEFLFLNTN